MTTNRKEVGMLLTRIQSEFLNTPSLTLTVKQAQKRCGGSLVLCQALLNVLVEARVLVKSPEGTYARYFPAVAKRTARLATRPEIAPGWRHDAA